MKINPESDLNDELRPEYKLSELKNRVRGKYAHLAEATPEAGQTVTLEPDVAAVFPDEASVNAALRFLIKSTKENPLVTASS